MENSINAIEFINSLSSKITKLNAFVEDYFIKKENLTSSIICVYFTDFEQLKVFIIPELRKFLKNDFVQIEENGQIFIYDIHKQTKLQNEGIDINEINVNNIFTMYNSVLETMKQIFKINQSVILDKNNLTESFLTQLQTFLQKLVEENKETLEDLKTVLNKNIEYPIIRGNQFLELFKFFRNFVVGLKIVELKYYSKEYFDEKTISKSLQTYYKSIKQISLKQSNKYESSDVLIFVPNTSKVKFSLVKFNTDTEVSGELLEDNVLVLKNFTDINFSFLFKNIENVFKYFRDQITSGKDVEIPNSLIEIFKDRKFRDIQIDAIKSSISEDNNVEIDIILTGSQTRYRTQMNKGYVLTFVLESSKNYLNDIAEFLYNLIDRYYVGNLTLNINLKELGEEIVSSLLNAPGALGQIANAIQNVYKDFEQIQQIGTNVFSQAKKTYNLFNTIRTKSKQYILKPSTTTSTDKQNNDGFVFSPQMQNKSIENNEELEKIVENYIKSFKFSKILEE